MSFQGTKKLRNPDIGDQLMSLMESNRIREKEEMLKYEVTQLQSKAEKLKKRRDNLRKDLIRNVNVANKNDGPLPIIKLNHYLRDSQKLESQTTQDQNASELLDAFRRSQVMQAYAVCHGVTTKTVIANEDLALEKFESHARLAAYQFHPVSEKSGKVHGPFEIVLANNPSGDDSIVLFSYHFPEPVDPAFNPSPKPTLVTDRQRRFNRDETRKPVVPIEGLEWKFLGKKSRSANENENNANILSSDNSAIEKNRNSDCCVDLFVRSVSDHLSAYISRMEQVQELLPQNGATKAECGEVFNVKFSRDVTIVKFVLKLVDSSGADESGNEAEEDADDLLLRISLEYEADGRRPKQGCVKIKISGNQKNRYNQEELDSLNKQCDAFYSKRIAEGIKAAFVE